MWFNLNYQTFIKYFFLNKIPFLSIKFLNKIKYFLKIILKLNIFKFLFNQNLSKLLIRRIIWLRNELDIIIANGIIIIDAIIK